MSNVAPPPELLRAPADRPAGKRGARGAIAAVAALGSLVPMIFFENAGDSAWARPGIVAGSLALIAGALLLWTGRRRVVVAVAVVAVAAGATLGALATAAERRAEARELREADRWAGAAFTYPRARGATLTKAEAEAVPKGLTRAELLARLGEPSARGVQRITDEPDLRCLAYRRIRGKATSQTLNAFCFRDGRYVELGEW